MRGARVFRSAGRVANLLLVIVIVGGCASVPEDLGREHVDALVTERGQPVEADSSQLLSTLIEQPLTRQSSVRIALINSPELQASYASLGFGAADIYEAGRIRNPIFSSSLLDSDVPGERDQLTLGLATSFADLLTLSARSRLSRGDFAALQQSVGADVMRVAADAERAYFHYVGAEQVARLRAQVAKAGALSAALAKRFRDAGNMTPRDFAIERAAASETRLAALEAEAQAIAARTELARVLGLSVGGAWQAPAQLQLPVPDEDDLNTLLALADESRLDLAAARTLADVTADRLGVVNWTRWLGDLEIGAERERETDGVKLTGPTVSWEIPIFNQHRDAVLRANADLEIAIIDVRRTMIDVDNQVRLAHATVENARERIDEYRDVLIPQRIETVARGQEEVNFMLIGVFELISLKQDEYDAYQGYLEAIRDYWIARTDLGLAAGTALPSRARIPDEGIDVERFIEPSAQGMDHSGHGTMDHSNHGAMQPVSDEPTGRPSGEGMDHSKHGEMDHGGQSEMNNADDKMIDGVDHESMDHNDRSNDAKGESDHSMHTTEFGNPQQHQHNDGELP